jgi:hypothetical protein
VYGIFDAASNNKNQQAEISKLRQSPRNDAATFQFSISLQFCHKMSNRFERTADKKGNEKNQKILKDLLLKPENKICADCKRRGMSRTLCRPH